MLSTLLLWILYTRHTNNRWHDAASLSNRLRHFSRLDLALDFRAQMQSTAEVFEAEREQAEKNAIAHTEARMQAHLDATLAAERLAVGGRLSQLTLEVEALQVKT